jgi:glycosyltransferase involved in cell wall biosynthesis
MIPEKVSVIIPAFNHAEFIASAVESCLAQTLSPWEVIVIDDGSEDGTRDVLNQFGSRIRYIRQERAGVSAARNRGIEESTGEFIAFLDADDIWVPERLERQVEEFKKDGLIGLVHSGLSSFNSETSEQLSEITEGLSGWIADELLLWKDPSIAAPGSIMTKRSVIMETGGFDPEIKVGEDWDFCYRIARKYKVAFVPLPLLKYRIHNSSAHRNIDEMAKGMGRFYKKAFDSQDPQVLKLKSCALSNYHFVLAGSYFNGGFYIETLRHSALSVVKYPRTAKRLALVVGKKLYRSIIRRKK